MSDQIPPNESELQFEIRNQITAHFIEQRANLGKQIDSKTEVGAKVAAQLDKTLISLSGGALVFSMTFVEKLAPAKEALWLLFMSWVAFAGAIVGVLFAMRAEQRLIHDQIISVLAIR